MLCTIVGAGPGLAAAIAARFGRQGFQVALLSRGSHIEVVQGLEAQGIAARAFRVDAAATDEVIKNFVEIERWGGLTEVLVYNAAVMEPGTASSLTAARALRDMATNFGGAVASVQAVLPGMKAKGAGTILLTGGGLALEPYPDWSSLGAGKAALRAYGIALHKELKRDGIRVSVVDVCGIVESGGPFDPARVADAYWRLHDSGSPPPREILYFPTGANAFYNDPDKIYSKDSFPITRPPGAEQAPSG